MEGNESSAGATPNSEPKPAAPAGIDFGASGLLAPVKERQYAEKSDIPLHQDTPPPAPEQKPASSGFLRGRMRIEDDAELAEFEAKQEPPKSVIPEFEVDASGAPSPGMLDSSSPAASQAMGMGTRSTSDWIYKNMEVIVPDICHNTSKIDTSKIRKLDLPEDIEASSITTLDQINENNRKQFKWGELHEVNIKYPLRDWLTEIGAEQTIPAWFMLLVGVVIVGYITYGKWTEVKKSNEAIAANFLKNLKQYGRKSEKKEDEE